MHASNLGGKAYLTERAARPVVQDLLSGLSHLHSLGIIHRDIKPENLVFAEPRPRWGVIPWGALSALGIVNEPRRTVKIIDLGVAQASFPCPIPPQSDPTSVRSHLRTKLIIPQPTLPSPHSTAHIP